MSVHLKNDFRVRLLFLRQEIDNLLRYDVDGDLRDETSTSFFPAFYQMLTFLYCKNRKDCFKKHL